MKLLHPLKNKHWALRQWHQDIINSAISSPLVTLRVCTCPWSKPLIYYSLHILLGFKLLGIGFGFAVFNYFSNFNKAIENVFRVCIAWYKHERGWENSRQLCKPETKSRVCISVENSPNPSSVNIRLCKHRKKVFYCFYNITFSRKNARLFVMALIKREILTSRKVLYTKSCTRNQFLFCKKMLSKIRIFVA